MQKLNDILILIAGLALLPFVADLIGGASISGYVAGIALAVVGLKGLAGK
tara:strand:+ start:6159 stop:6308 length:150 start_codon:yes stop_codon:yes gene_type:complete